MPNQPNQPRNPRTANELMLDAALRHRVFLGRYSTGVANKLARLLGEADADLVDRIERSLASAAGGARSSQFARDRLEAVLKRVREDRIALASQVHTALRDTLRELAREEADFEAAAMSHSVPVKLDLASPSAARLNALVTSRPLHGRVLRDWTRRMARQDVARIEQQLRIGVLEGEEVPALVRRVRGDFSRAGALAKTRQDVEAIVRTAVTHVSNSAREEVWDANQDIITGLRWTSTLDGRTSAICQARDGEVYPTDEGPRPPAHFNCRSVMVAVIDGEETLDPSSRPFVRDSRTRRAREVDLREEARDEGITVQEARRNWADANVGQVPDATTYGEWLSRQPASFQDEVLGTTKGRLFRSGGLTLDKFVDREGEELTIAQLRQRHPTAFQRAGV